jgi:hypothetical protein
MTQIKKDIEIRLKRFHLKLIDSEIYIFLNFMIIYVNTWRIHYAILCFLNIKP